MDRKCGEIAQPRKCGGECCALELYSCHLSISHAITNYSMALESQLLTYGPPRGLREHLIPRPLRVSKKVQLSARKDTFLQ